MEKTLKPKGLTQEELHWILEVTRRLAAPCDLATVLSEVLDAATGVLDAEAGTVWLYDPTTNELVLQVSNDLEPIRIPADRGIAGACLRSREMINVPDCYADHRFSPALDHATGFRTRCMLTMPLVGHDDSLVGVLQVLNKRDGVFDANDEAVANSLRAHCAIALQRVRMTEKLVVAEKLRQEISVAREIQIGTLPQSAPAIPGYDLAGIFHPTDDTGGDTYDFVPTADGRLMILMGDATGHGIGPALSATQVRAMLRLAQRLGADLDDTFRHINDQLVDDLPDDRFVTAFLGQLDPHTHELRYHSGGQGPLLHFHARELRCELLTPTTFPMGAVPLARVSPPRTAVLAPGDIFALISDGVYEYQDAQNRLFGEDGVAQLLRREHARPMQELIGVMMDALAGFGRGAPQLDDITMVLIRRLPESPATERAVAADAGARIAAQSFARSLDSLDPIFAFIRDFCEAEGLDPAARTSIGFAVEELFTNMLKYNAAGRGAIELQLACAGREFVGRLSDPDSERFDVTATPDARVDLPIELRVPGGLGLHLVRRVMDAVEYDYTGRCSRISFRKKLETS
ncbi:MAG TPA: SpoIIE family protein phosphatase [Candidatus Saccharimonadia bacterium]|nr:SpoIIE family protein phosphatase [Candidatus Saccharimonadia bacterium]